MTSHLQEAERNLVSEQAAKWLTILAEGNPAERAPFVTWLKQSPRHVEEFLFASAALKTFVGRQSPDAVEVDRIVAEALAAKPPTNVVPWLKDARTSEDMPDDESLEMPGALVSRKRPRTRVRWPAVAAAAIALVALGWTFRGTITRLAASHTYTTAVGEQRAVRLPDGSLVFLNARSRLDVHYSPTARDLELSEGEGVFQVAHDATRPFRVHTRDALVQAIGTQFNVYRRPEGTIVSVLEGRVRISSQRQGDTTPTAAPADQLTEATSLAAGEEASVASSGKVSKRVQPDVAAAIAWRQRRLVFRADRLEDIAAEFSRYSPRRIELKDAAVRNTRLTGTFDADDPASLVQFLEEMDDLEVRRDGDNFVVSER